MLLIVVALLGQASAVSATKPPRARLDPNKVICRETQVTGSLAGGKKICMKRSDWERQSSDAQHEVNGWNTHMDPANRGG